MMKKRQSIRALMLRYVDLIDNGHATRLPEEHLRLMLSHGIAIHGGHGKEDAARDVEHAAFDAARAVRRECNRWEWEHYLAFLFLRFRLTGHPDGEIANAVGLSSRRVRDIESRAERTLAEMERADAEKWVC